MIYSQTHDNNKRIVKIWWHCLQIYSAQLMAWEDPLASSGAYCHRGLGTQIRWPHSSKQCDHHHILEGSRSVKMIYIHTVYTGRHSLQKTAYMVKLVNKNFFFIASSMELPEQHYWSLPYNHVHTKITLKCSLRLGSGHQVYISVYIPQVLYCKVVL